MSLWDKLKGELIDIIEWTEPSNSELLAYRFPRYQNEIKNGAQLTVREGQAVVFVNEGQIADVFAPGMYRLETQNLPILATLKGWKYGFNSPFKAEVYFVSTRQRTDQKWGTANPIMLRDPEFGPVRVRAFGTYALKVTDPGVFLKEIIGTDPSFETYEIANQLRSLIVSRFTDALGKAKIAVLDLAGNYEEVSQKLREPIMTAFAGMGLTLTQFYIENISLPPEVEQALDTRTKMGVIGDMSRFTQFQTAEAIRDAAQNQGGIAGMGAGLGTGLGVGQAMTGAIAGAMQPGHTTTAGPPPVPTQGMFFIAQQNQQTGPFDLGILAAKAHEGVLTRQTLVWKEGMAGWAPAESQPELQALFASAPPPLPPT